MLPALLKGATENYRTISNSLGADCVPIEEEKIMMLNRQHDRSSLPTLAFRKLKELREFPVLT
jgi:hypothetical protein